MVDVVAFLAFVVVPTMALVAAIGLGGYEIYRIDDYRLLVLIVLLGVMLQHQVLEWLTFVETGTVGEEALGEVFETTANLVASGGVYGLLALLRRERALSAERDRQEREFRSMVESAPTPMLYHCPRQIRVVNDAAVSMLNAAGPDELEGRRLTEFVVPADRERVKEVLDPSTEQRVVADEPVTLETVDGEQRYAVFSAEPLRFGGRDGIQITLNDITERERSRAELEETKERLQTLFHNIQDGVLVIDMEAERIVDANERACEMLGYAKDELTDLRPRDIHPHEIDRLETFLESAAREKALTTERLSCRRNDGGRFAAEVSAGRTTVDGAPWLLVSVRDISEREQRKRQIDFLHRLFRHNVRNRMNVVVGNANRLRERGSGEVEEIAESIKTVGDRFVETSEKIRQITRILKNGVGSEVETTDVSGVVRTLVEQYREETPDETFETDIEAGVRIKGDSSIRVAVDNLLENAIQHAGEAPTLRVSVRQRRAGTGSGVGTAEIVVEDDGPGIPDNERVVAADPDAQSQLEHGSGLGLHLINQTVGVYGGEFEIDSRADGDGTRASIRLPLAADTNPNRVESRSQA